MNIIKTLGSRAFWGTFFKRLLETFGVFWLVVESLSMFAPGFPVRDWKYYVVLVSLSLAVAIFLAYPRSSVSADIPGANVGVTVKQGDIFDAMDNVVIGMADTFDTEISDKLISNRSLQAQLVAKRFNGSVAEFDAAVEGELVGMPSKGDPDKTIGKSNRYPLGTTLFVTAGGIRHYLCAYCRMPATLRAETDVCTLLSSLEECWAKVRNSGNNESISMPVIGADFGRTGLTHTQLIQIIVLSFVAANRNQHVAPHLTIYVHSSNAGNVDFSALRLWLRGVLWA